MESISVSREEVVRFLSIQGYGYGDSYGDGSGDGDGYGYGDGSGDGDGYGSGYGSGDGDGYGSGYGSGDGDGYGYGYGSGYGYGDGSGDGSGDGDGYISAYEGNIVDYIDGVPTIITRIHDNIAKGYVIKSDMTLEACYIAKAGYSFAHGETLKDAIADAEAKEMERMPVEERIEKFIDKFGSLDSEHTGKEFYYWHHILTGSCRMGRDKFCNDNDIDLDKKYTVRYFLSITKNAYGGSVINEILETYKMGEIK